MIGTTVGRLVVLEAAGRDRKRNLLWLCECSCGAITVVAGWRLRKQEPRSCGCLQRETVSRLNTSHGMSKGRLYNIWANMLARCNNDRTPHFNDYGGRGISVCQEWRDFLPFASWALSNGYSDLLSIDRINNNGNYEPSNCRWATNLEQSRNKRPRKDQKLTDEQVSQIREDNRACAAIAIEYHVRETHIRRIKHGERRQFPTGERIHA